MLVVRPRGWHLPEKHVLRRRQAGPGGLFDFGLYFFHNAQELIDARHRPVLLPAQDGEPPRGAPLERRLRPRAGRARHAARHDQGDGRSSRRCRRRSRWTRSSTSCASTRRASTAGAGTTSSASSRSSATDPGSCLPDRAQVTMDQPFLRAYAQLLIQTCHRRGAPRDGRHGGADPDQGRPRGERGALAKVRADKVREVSDGHDGTWVAHPGLVPVAREIFDAHMPGPNQLDQQREDVDVTRRTTCSTSRRGRAPRPACATTSASACSTSERGCAAWAACRIYNLMEDAATAEISRAQVWQWIHHGEGPRRRTDGDRGPLPRRPRRGAREDPHRRRPCAHQATTASKRRASSSSGSRQRRLRGVPDPARLRVPGFGARRYPPITTSRPTASFRPPVRASAQDRPRSLTRSEKAPQWCYATTRCFPNDLSDERPTVGEERRCSTECCGCDTPSGSPSAGRASTVRTRRRTSSGCAARSRSSTRSRGSARERLWDLAARPGTTSSARRAHRQPGRAEGPAGLKAIYSRGWQVAADANLAGQMYPDQSLYPANSVPHVVQRINQALHRADQIEHAEGKHGTLLVRARSSPTPRPASAAAQRLRADEGDDRGGRRRRPLRGPARLREEVRPHGRQGAGADQPVHPHARSRRASPPTCSGVPTVARRAHRRRQRRSCSPSDVDERDTPFLTGERTAEGFYRVQGGLDARHRARPRLRAVRGPGLVRDLHAGPRGGAASSPRASTRSSRASCSPTTARPRSTGRSTSTTRHRQVPARARRDGLQVPVRHPGRLPRAELRHVRAGARLRERGMAAYSELQQAEFAAEKHGYTATRHQREVGTGYFDEVAQVISGGTASTTALTAPPRRSSSTRRRARSRASPARPRTNSSSDRLQELEVQPFSLVGAERSGE